MKGFATLLILIFLTGCDDKAVPADILPRQKMEKILWELLEADEWALHSFPMDTVARKQAALQHYATVYRINGIDPEEFKRSYDYYSERPTLLSPVLDSVRNKAVAPSAAPPDAKLRKPLRGL